MFDPIPPEVESMASQTIGAALEVHRVLGPGFLERIYQEALCLELQSRGIGFERERPVAVQYRDVAIQGQRIDLIVGTCVLVELKALSRFDRAHDAQLISYLRTTGLRLGLLLNFNRPTLRQGIRPIDRCFVTFVPSRFFPALWLNRLCVLRDQRSRCRRHQDDRAADERPASRVLTAD